MELSTISMVLHCTIDEGVEKSLKEKEEHLITCKVKKKIKYFYIITKFLIKLGSHSTSL